MHPEAYAAMDRMLSRIDLPWADVLDVGAVNVNGTYRPLVEGRGWHYVGLDLVPGPNVDVVATEPYRYPFHDGWFDVMMSGSTMEHVTAIWLWVPELVRVLRPGGLLALHTHWQWPEHRFPVDCWRVLSDGMRFLFDETGQLERYEIEAAANGDLYASAFKVAK